jgi:hypothetical protein
MSQPAYAGIAGLSVREFKPTGLQAGGCLVSFFANIYLSLFYIKKSDEFILNFRSTILLCKFYSENQIYKKLAVAFRSNH